MMGIALVFETDVLRLICGYVLQWKKFEKKTVF